MRSPPGLANILVWEEPNLSARSYWWVNNKQTFKQEVSGNYLWAPLVNAHGGNNEFYNNMARVQPGDLVFSYASTQVRAVGVCTSAALRALQPAEFGKPGKAWANEGRRLPVSFTLLKDPLKPKQHMDVLAPLLPETHSPIRASGDGNQGAYLAKISHEMAGALIGLIGPAWPAEFMDQPVSADSTGESIEEADARAEADVLNMPDIPETTKEQIVKSRRGHGQFRRRLEVLEKRCRVTGVSDLRHLRASHIKPWRVCSNIERLDGNNGLLLSPHIDHLFDRNLISFEDNGQMLTSGPAIGGLLETWGVDGGANVGPFSDAQLHYLAYHREVFYELLAL